MLSKNGIQKTDDYKAELKKGRGNIGIGRQNPWCEIGTNKN